MRLLSPNGVPVTLSDEQGERYKEYGYRPVAEEETPSPPVVPAAPKRRRKTTTNGE